MVKNFKKPDLVARQKPPFYTTEDFVFQVLTFYFQFDMTEQLL